MKRSGLFIGILVICGLLFVPTDDAFTQAKMEELKIGLIGPLSGPAMLWGNQYLEACKMAAEEIKARGGVKVGNKAYEVKLYLMTINIFQSRP